MNVSKKCEGCGLKVPSLGLPAEGKAQWCGGCAKGQAGAVNVASKKLDANNEPDVRQLVQDYLGLSTEQQAAFRLQLRQPTNHGGSKDHLQMFTDTDLATLSDHHFRRYLDHCPIVAARRDKAARLAEAVGHQPCATGTRVERLLGTERYYLFEKAARRIFPQLKDKAATAAQRKRRDKRHRRGVGTIWRHVLEQQLDVPDIPLLLAEMQRLETPGRGRVLWLSKAGAKALNVELADWMTFDWFGHGGVGQVQYKHVRQALNKRAAKLDPPQQNVMRALGSGGCSRRGR